MDKSPVHEACEAVGGIEALAGLIGCTSRTIKIYRRNGEWPLDRVPAVSEATGIPKHRLHPAFAQEKGVRK